MLLRARVSAFLSGVAIAGVFAVYQLRKDVTDSHKILKDQVSSCSPTFLPQDHTAWLRKAAPSVALICFPRRFRVHHTFNLRKIVVERLSQAVTLRFRSFVS